MRFSNWFFLVVATLPFSLAAAGARERTVPAPPSVLDLSGAWNVTMRPMWSSCEDGQGKDMYVNQWLIVHKADDNGVKIDVTGTSDYNFYRGRLSGSALALSNNAETKEYANPSKFYVNNWSTANIRIVDDKHFEGERYMASTYGKGGGSVYACVYVHKVSGSRQ
jgi:hypothetical protein